ncbi:ABC transporter-like protein [Leptomonas pyrrhocoris]|uniref:ABC transporter-like protein n=1 Tax=Leptomonas pyrrhocoris TaxID=157538 RepID=A0A0M9G8P6_LEPPY|nr:ABC transporter-like protein [Leptomonas pyrrhocoris]KPA84779.1 ABC transporter-like protein [Leptomonas pyrrhocoris]|eukprot:XP_015663218.1 ABC transporter-like protein [Leptomonas pyrrhocoris]
MDAGASLSPAAAHAEVTGTLQLVRFAYAYVRPQLRAIVSTVLFMIGATILSISIPVLAEEIVSYGTETVTKTVSGVVHVDNATAATGVNGAQETTAGSGRVRSYLIDIGPFSERLLKPFLPLLFSVLRRFYDGVGDGVLAWPSPYVEGILCRCGLMGLAVLCYHLTSLTAHLAAYHAGMGAQSALVQDSVSRILHTQFPERVAIVNAVKLAQIVTASGSALSDTVGDLLTNVLSRAMYVVGFFAVMLYLSYQLTLTILVGVVAVQCLFFFEGRALHRQGSRVTAEESSTQAFIANILQRNETIFVFKSRDFVLTRMADRLARVRRLNNGLKGSIHGFAALSSSMTRLILVLALGLSNYYQQKGQLDMRHTVLYFACFQSLVNMLAALSSDVNKTSATLGRLKTLEAMLRWYSEPLPITAADGKSGGSGKVDSLTKGETTRAVVDVQASSTAPVSLEDVSFKYPAIPAFFSEGGADGAGAVVAVVEDSLSASVGARHINGIANVSFSAQIGGITALYGPSGSGKSTCLRMLCGLVRPHSGTVHTQRGAILLEQQHAIFIGTVAENILLADLTALGDKTSAASAYSTEVRRRVSDAAEKSGCASFLSNPFGTLIESIDHPQFSGGQLQRIALARVFAQTAGYSLVLLDEPTSGLDKSAVEVLLGTLKDLRDVHHKTVLISTHDHRVAEIADKVVDLSSRGMQM